MGYTVNPDGTVTRGDKPAGTNTGKNDGGGSNNFGCWIFVIIAIIVGIIIAVSNYDSTNNSSDNESEESVVDDSEITVYDDDVETDYLYDHPYLSVSSSSVSFDSSGGSQTIFIDTNSDWYISIDTDSWGHLTRSGNQLTLSVDANSSTDQRIDYFCIKAGDVEKRIDITQSGAYHTSSVTGSITRVWTDHNVCQNDIYGMRIHVKFDIYNMLNQTGKCAAYFYFSNDTPLNDYNNNYSAADGKVSVGQDFIPNYQNCTFNDLQMFIPYSELHMGESASLYYVVIIWNGSEMIDKSSNVYFNFNK